MYSLYYIIIIIFRLYFDSLRYFDSEFQLIFLTSNFLTLKINIREMLAITEYALWKWQKQILAISDQKLIINHLSHQNKLWVNV